MIAFLGIFLVFSLIVIGNANPWEHSFLAASYHRPPVGSAGHCTGFEDGRYIILTFFVFCARGASASSPTPYMRTVTGTLNVLFLVVMQLLSTVPVSHAQLLITTVTVGFLRAVPASSTWP